MRARLRTKPFRHDDAREAGAVRAPRRLPNLFVCGEVLDAFGPIGGYNFLWAWATARAAGIGAAS